ncbi:hypothetical protein SS50377_24958 [Spironucleus salmonicida]|uniref:EF-hand domain-containing protein n=1 Tax=Spironucleus salmonicida TaxID=348837 RepID=V6LGP4_9EUKA|nr:hypothetical protein SS50377_24958 [Spironucleus salmonicida]|eukprot:EST43483.1 Hypothetical protein SS50377_16854 [Spironucleus salmonicida]
MFKASTAIYEQLFGDLKTEDGTVPLSCSTQVLKQFKSIMTPDFVKELLSLLDLDDSETLSKSEFMRFCYIAENTFKPRDTARSLFCFADTDFSGSIDAQEFVWIMHRIIGEFSDADMTQAFKECATGEAMDYETFMLLMREFA